MIQIPMPSMTTASSMITALPMAGMVHGGGGKPNKSALHSVSNCARGAPNCSPGLSFVLFFLW